jgi:hypothetical protein
MKRLAIQLSHELEVPRHDDLQADDRNQASCRDRLTLTETALSSHYCSDFQDTRHRRRSQSPFFRVRRDLDEGNGRVWLPHALGRINGDKSNTLGFAVVDCLFWAASGAKCRFESELFGVASCHDSEPKGRPRTTEAYTDSSSFFVKARFTRVTQSFGRGIGLAQIIRMRHSQLHRRKSDPGCFHD